MIERRNCLNQPVSARDILRKIYLGRLNHTHRLDPPRPDLVERCQSILAALDMITDQEELYSWHISFGAKHLAGVSTYERVVFSNLYDNA